MKMGIMILILCLFKDIYRVTLGCSHVNILPAFFSFAYFPQPTCPITAEMAFASRIVSFTKLLRLSDAAKVKSQKDVGAVGF